MHASFTDVSAQVKEAFRLNRCMFSHMSRGKGSEISVIFRHNGDGAQHELTVYSRAQLDDICVTWETLRPFIVRARYEYWRSFMKIADFDGAVTTAKDVYAYAVADKMRDEAYREFGDEFASFARSTPEEADARIDAARSAFSVAVVRHCSAIFALRQQIGQLPEGLADYMGLKELY